MKKIMSAVASALCLATTIAANAQQQNTSVTTATNKTTTTTTTTIVTETVVKEKATWTPFRICVMDFSSQDTLGQKRFLDHTNKPIVIPAQCTLNTADRQSIDSVVQGYVRMIDAKDASMTNTANRNAQAEDNTFTREKAVELYNSVVQGESRPMVIGAQYLNAYLGGHADVFSCLEPSLMERTMKKLQSQQDFPQDFLRKIAETTGATHLVYGTVADITSSTRTFKGYGIETKSIIYKLDVIVKMVDLVAQRTVHVKVYTGTSRVEDTGTGTTIDSNLFQTLMKSALQQAADDLYDACKPGPANKITVTTLTNNQ